MAQLVVATCQFPVGADVTANATQIRAHARRAARSGARLVHFPEAAVTGYAGTDIPSNRNLNWTQVAAAIDGIREVAAAHHVWLAVGTAHELPGHRPHNSVLMIGPDGEIAERYDKRFCSGNPQATEGDLAHYTPGDHPTVVDVDGVRCGVLICHDYNYPELGRDYAARGVALILHSFHTGGISARRLARIRGSIGHRYARLNPAMTYPGITMPASMIAAAAANHTWISAANSSTPYSAWGAQMVRADGVVVGRLPRHRAGTLLTSLDTDIELYDSTRHWRDRAMRGLLHSGTLPADQ